MPTHRQALPAAETTLAEALQGHGYRAAIYGKWHLGEDPDDPRAHGFDMQVPKTWRKGWPRRGYYSPFRMEGVDDGKPGDYLTDKLTDVALEFIEDSKGTPFFLYLSHFAVHDPIHGRQDLIEKYRRKLAKMDRPDSPAFVLEGNPDAPEKLSRAQLAELIKRPSHRSYRVLPKQTVKIKQHQDNIRFAAMVEAMDESLGRVLAKLKELQLDQNTIIIFFSDNGGMAAANFGNPRRVVAPDKLDFAYATSNLPLRGAKGWLYEGGVRVPMIVKWPGRAKAGSTCAEPVMSTDFYPSLLEMAGLTARPAQHVDGRSFVPGLTGKPYERGAIYWHFPHYSNHGMQSPGGGIRLGDYKLLEYYERGTVQLFNLKTDPGEQNDLAQKEPAIAAKLRANLHQWRRDVKARMIARKKSQ